MSLTLPRGDKTPIIWSIAGSDSSCGAGLQTDLKTITALGGHACTIVTSITAQSTCEVRGYEAVSPSMLKAQIESLHADMPPDAIKIGMLGDGAGVHALTDTLKKIDSHIVYDPVMISSSGTKLLDDATMAAMKALLPLVNLLTPNLVETELLTGIEIKNDADVKNAAIAILQMGVNAVLIKGWNTNGFAQDYFQNAAQSFWLTLPKRDGEVTRGTGCTMASAIATAHAFNYDEADAAVIAKAYVHRCLRQNRKLGKGPPIAIHSNWPANADDFPWLSLNAEAGRHRLQFPVCDKNALAFYPVVESAAWLERLLPVGVRSAQLRVKNLQGPALENEIQKAIALGKKYNTQLFINDYWQLAIKYGAYGVHLGQEDLDTADLAAIAKAGLRLGISTHSYAEAARAHGLQPSYIALGPVFPTTLKSMNFAPQGIETVELWKKLLPYPLVAIGGIKLEQAANIYAAGADSIAVVSDVTQHADPEARVKAWLQLTKM